MLDPSPARGRPRERPTGRLVNAAISFFLIYTVLIFFILVNVFLAILNDAYGSVKGERDERFAQLKAEREERNRLNPPATTAERVAKLQRAARGRFHRFQARVNAMARRRKRKPATATDAIDSLYSAPDVGVQMASTTGTGRAMGRA